MELFATLARYLPNAGRHGGARVEVADGSTIGELARALHIPPALEVLALVNGHESEASRVLTDGDTVTLYPPLAGGAS